MAKHARLTPVWIVGFAAWLGVAGVALGAMSEYASRPGAQADAPATWPLASHIARTPGRATLVMIAHTKCACTRASLHELDRVMARAGSSTEAFVVFVGPRAAKGSVDLLDLRDTARAIPGVRVIEDEAEARLFGAFTSGQVLAYTAEGSLAFRGGITNARGHEGDSAGNEMLRRLVAGGTTAPSGAEAKTSASEVFGCVLFSGKQP